MNILAAFLLTPVALYIIVVINNWFNGNGYHDMLEATFIDPIVK
jgi:hypothetical protein